MAKTICIGGPSSSSGTSTPIPGGNITFSPGQGAGGAPGGSVIWKGANGVELLRLSEDGLHLFGQPIPLQKVLELLTKIQEKPACSCSTQQILNAGCICGGN